MKATKSQNKTKILAEKGKQHVTIIREFEAPRELVFKAHEDPELIRQWLGPRDRTVVIHHYDSRSGGSYRYSITDKSGEEVASFNGAIHEVTAPERIIQTFEFEGLPERGHVTLDTMTFEKLPGNRTRVTTHSVCRFVEDRDAMMQSGMETGVYEGYEKMDELLAAM
jgi:uncharacterized protein YndB with AHSA1/START domain